jgi:hypothetical protein
VFLLLQLVVRLSVYVFDLRKTASNPRRRAMKKKRLKKMVIRI